MVKTRSYSSNSSPPGGIPSSGGSSGALNATNSTEQVNKVISSKNQTTIITQSTATSKNETNLIVLDEAVHHKKKISGHELDAVNLPVETQRSRLSKRRASKMVSDDDKRPTASTDLNITSDSSSQLQFSSGNIA